MFSFGWFSSGRDQAAIDLLAAAHDHMASGFIPGRITYVFCDRSEGESPASDRFLAAVRDRGLPLVTHSSRELRRAICTRDPHLAEARTDFDRQVLDKLAPFSTPVAVLAGYMLIVSPLLCLSLLCLNLHPALPGGPVGTWQQVMWQLMETNAAEAGAMMHLATPALDQGPPVAFCHLPLSSPEFAPLWEDYRRQRRDQTLAQIQQAQGERQPLFAAIRAAQLLREFPLILLTLKSLAEGTVTLTSAGAVVNGRPAPQGFDISDLVEAFLRTHPRGW